MPDVENVILLNADLQPIGEMPKSRVHSSITPLHFGFSSYLFNDQGQVLVTRRALAKVAWPGVWTNSACGHPAHNEALEAAVARRAAIELGLTVANVTALSTAFRYCATDASGIQENEYCPVFAASITCPPSPASDEVMDYQWVALEALIASAALAPWAFSPWMVDQLKNPDIVAALRRFIQ